jgi:hypothetical protein
MENSNSQLVLVSTSKLESLLGPVLNRLDIIESILNKKTSPTKKDYYRNKDLKEKFGLSHNTVIKYRETGIIPFTMIGEVYLYPIKQLDIILQANSNLDLFQNKAS